MTYRNIFEQRAAVQAEMEREGAERAAAEKQWNEALGNMSQAQALTPAEAAKKREREAALERQRKDEAAADKLKKQLWLRYQSAAPGASEEDFERAYPRLLQQHRERVALGEDPGLPEATSEFADPARWGL